MKIIYLLITGGVCVCATYFAGMRVATQKCNARIAAAAVGAQSQIFQIMGDTNAETVNTSTDDIRRVLRTEYTIAE